MTNQKIVIIGGGTAGIACATRLRRLSENAEITIIEKGSYIGYPITSIPYYISGVIKDKETVLNNHEEKLGSVYNINILKKSEVVKINILGKKISIKNTLSDAIVQKEYDKLIIACGNVVSPLKISDENSINIFNLTNMDDAIGIRNYIEKTSVKNVTIIGNNYLSCLMAYQFIINGFQVTIIDDSYKLIKEFNDEFSFLLKDELRKLGVKIYLDSSVKRLFYNDNNVVYKLELNKSTFIETQLIINLGKQEPNTDLLKHSGVFLGKRGGILVDEFMQTNIENIYAIGSITEIDNILTRNKQLFESLTNSLFHGRICATNIIFDKSSKFNGTSNVRLLKFGKFLIGTIGISLKEALDWGINAVEVKTFSSNSERFISSSGNIHIIGVFNKENRKIIGASVCGKSNGVDKRLDMLSMAVQSGLTVDELEYMQFSYNPEISSNKDPVNTLAMIAKNSIDTLTKISEIEQIDFSKDDIILLDIRTKNEYQKEHLQSSVWIPLEELRSRISEIPKDKKIYIYSHLGLKGYVAERFLRGVGFENVYNIDGGISSIKIKENMD